MFFKDKQVDGAGAIKRIQELEGKVEVLEAMTKTLKSRYLKLFTNQIADDIFNKRAILRTLNSVRSVEGLAIHSGETLNLVSAQVDLINNGSSPDGKRDTILGLVEIIDLVRNDWENSKELRGELQDEIITYIAELDKGKDGFKNKL